MTYKPLPPIVTIKKSSIDGLGLFATDNIEANVVLGTSHVADDRFEDGWIRTPLGGFINHSENPNCVIAVNIMEMTYNLKTNKPVVAGEELTLYYNLYSVKDPRNGNPK